MKFIERVVTNRPHTVELTRRNLTTLLAKLDDPLSHKTLMAPGEKVQVRAVEDDEHYTDRKPGEIFMPTSGVTL